jgi:hypothetical protein
MLFFKLASLAYLVSMYNKRRNVQTFNREFRGLRETLHHIDPPKENEYVLSDIFENSSIFPFPKGLRTLSKMASCSFSS